MTDNMPEEFQDTAKDINKRLSLRTRKDSSTKEAEEQHLRV